MEEIRPPMTTRASGFWISEPMPWLRAAGRKPMTATMAETMMAGGGSRSRARWPSGAAKKSICAQPMGVPLDMHDRWAPAATFEFANHLIS